jgi:pantetheine-phosphate adenylyltransferase
MTRTTCGVFAGTFDPYTNGHADIIHRSLRVFDRVIVAILSNPAKSSLFTLDERIKLISAELTDYHDRATVDTFSGLLVDFARQNGAKVLIRGLRAISDYDYEAQMALMNKSLNDDIETVFLVSREQNSYISSTIVKQVAALGGDVSNQVPPKIALALKAKYKSLQGKK